MVKRFRGESFIDRYDYLILRCLYKKGSLELGEIERTVNIERPNRQEHTTKLLAQGLITIRPSKRHWKAKDATITDAGKQMFKLLENYGEKNI